MLISTHTANLSALTHPMHHEACKNWLWALTELYPCCRLQTIGTTAGGRSIYAVSLGGDGELPTVVYAGGFSPSDWLSSAVLLRFLAEYSRMLTENGRLYRVHLPYLFAHRRICVCPVVNWDAMETALETGEAVCGYRNGLGADLAGFFGDGTEKEFSEKDPVEKCPESTALQQYLRWQAPALFCTFRCSSTAGLTVPKQPSGRAGTVGRLLSRMLQAEKGTEDPLTAIPSWYAGESGHLAYDAALPDNGGEEGFYEGYAAVREMLFSAPLLI